MTTKTVKTKTIVPKMNIVIVGHVDHGKSTVIGRLLADTGSLPTGKLEQVQADCKRNAKPFEYAFLLDALKDEQAQGITIDSARCFFNSKKRQYIIIDAPGHIEFLKNMISGAARAEAALLIIDAHEGIRENSKRHGYLLSMLGIKQLAVCVNKMDLVDYKKTVFDKIVREYRAFLKQVGLEPQFFVPMAAMHGENIAARSKHMLWYKGKHVLDVLDAFGLQAPLEAKPFRMPVQAVYKFTEEGDDRRIVAGRVESGSIKVGDKVVFYPSNKSSQIKTIEAFNAPARDKISAGYSTGFTFSEQIYVNRGEVMCKAGESAPQVSSLFTAEIFWMGKKPMVIDKEYRIKLGSVRIPVYLRQIKKSIDASDLKNSKKNSIDRHDVAECVLETRSALAFDLAGELEATGRFVVVDEYDISGGGIITESLTDHQEEIREQIAAREQNWDVSAVSPEERSAAYGHEAKFILLTGRVGVDKKSIGKLLEEKLFKQGQKVYFLGLGNLLRGLDADLEKQRKARREHVRRLAEVAHLFMDAGLVVVATASNLNDDELRLVQEVTQRERMLVVNVGKNDFRQSILDLEIKAGEKAELAAEKILNFLEVKKQG